MLTLEQYTQLWIDPMTKGGFGQPFTNCHCLPCYQDYVIRENQYQDYLDIFRGKNTRPDRVKIGINPPCDWYYDHPFEEFLKGEKIPITKIMIGEAAPPLNPVVIDSRGNDRNNSYFYNVKHVKGTSYFSALVNALGIAGVNKVSKLYKMALNGVVLLDLFPFAVNYSTVFRQLLVANAVHTFFWSGAPESIDNRINSLAAEGLLSKFKGEPKLVLLAPETIMHDLARQINDPFMPLPTFGTSPRMGVNVLVPPGVAHHGHFVLTGPAILNGIYPLHLNQVPIYACTSYSGAGFGPHELFIRSALFLP